MPPGSDRLGGVRLHPATLASLPLIAACASPAAPAAPGPAPALRPAFEATAGAPATSASSPAPEASAAASAQPAAAVGAAGTPRLPTRAEPRWTLRADGRIEGFGFTADGASLALWAGEAVRLIDVATQRVAAEQRSTTIKGLDPGRARFAEVAAQRGRTRLLVRSIASGDVAASFDGSKEGLESIPLVTFSADGRRLSFEADSEDCAPQVWSVDDRRRIPFSTDFTTAAPICHGALTASGNFVYFLARASGAFQDVKTKKVGPGYGRSVMSPRDTFVVSFPDRNWVGDETSPTRLTTAKNGRTAYTLDNDTGQAAFSFNERLLATTSRRGVEIRATDDRQVLATIPELGATSLAFSPRGGLLALQVGERLSVFALTSCEGQTCAASSAGDEGPGGLPAAAGVSSGP